MPTHPIRKTSAEDNQYRIIRSSGMRMTKRLRDKQEIFERFDLLPTHCIDYAQSLQVFSSVDGEQCPFHFGKRGSVQSDEIMKKENPASVDSSLSYFQNVW